MPMKAIDLINENIKLAKEKKIPETWDFTELKHSYSSICTTFEFRTSFIKQGSYAAISKNWVNALAKWIGNRKCLEVGAGYGMLAKALKDAGVFIKASDNRSWCNGLWQNGEKHCFTKVLKYSAKAAIKRYGNNTDILILCWPPYVTNFTTVLQKRKNELIASNVVKQFKEFNPKGLVVYIGESMYGCTADDEFFNVVKFIKSNKKFNIAAGLFQSWPGLYDTLCLAKIK